jgi:MFS family permease
MAARSGQGLSALRHRDFARFLSARFIVTCAVQMQTVAVGWQVYAVTQDPLDLGLVGLSQFLPFVVLVLPAGQIADRHDRRRILVLCYLLEALCAALLLAFSLASIESAWPVFAVMVLFGVARAFAMPTGQALIPNLVPREDFGGAIALYSSTFQIATILGPTLGGLVYLAGPEILYGMVGGLLIASSALMRSVEAGGRHEVSREPADLRSVLSGLHFVRSRPSVLGAISLDLFAVLFGGATALLPIYASDILNVGPVGLGVLRTAPGIGAASCAAVLAFMPVTHRVGHAMFAGVAVYGLATVVFGFSTHFVLSLVALVLLGAGDMVSVYIRHLLVQLETPDAIRGRVSAVNAVFIGASNELGEFRAGVMAAWWGTVPAVIVGGMATLLVSGLWIRLFPSLWSLNRFPRFPDTHAETTVREPR